MNNVADKCGGKKGQKIVVKCHVFSKDFETKTDLEKHMHSSDETFNHKFNKCGKNIYIMMET